MNAEHAYYDGVIQIFAIVVPIFATIIIALVAFGVKQMVDKVNLQIKATADQFTGQIQIVTTQMQQIAKEIEEHREACTDREKKMREWSHWVTDSVGKIAMKTETKVQDIPY